MRFESVCLLLMVSAAPSSLTLMSPQEFQSIPTTEPDWVSHYGEATSNFGHLRLPKGNGPFPVAVLIHGGCFRAEFAKLDELSQLAEALRREGVATWNIEYRRVGQPGGGWPGTYRDIAQGIDHLRVLSADYPLDLANVVIVGHSAGGHLALWAASRGKLLENDPLFKPHPLQPRGIVNLAGLPDLRTYVQGYEKACGGPVVHDMLGGEDGIAGQNGRSASPNERLPLGVRQTMVLGEFEDFVPPSLANDYVAKAQASGDDAKLVTIPRAGHFEIAASTTQAWPEVRHTILTLSKTSVKKPQA